MERSLQNGSGGGKEMTRAEKFEDEKRRIIESCFGKKDEDNSLLESYITHIRIIEDSAYPSSPPPPNAGNDAKKPRLIIVAVRKSGRVRMHKARENGNGSFSIGKTWMLDDLSAVQSYSGAVSVSEEEELQRQWAGDKGFTVTIGKPYYWEANTNKEKQFFIASLVKIYTKYTGGKIPALVGFDARERDQLLGTSASRSATPSLQSGASTPTTNQPQSRPSRRDPSREAVPQNQASRDAVQRSQPSVLPVGNSSFTSQNSRPQMRNQRAESNGSSMDSSGVAPQASQSNLRRLAGSNQSQESFGRSEDGSTLPPRSRNGLNGMPGAPGRFQERSATPNSQRAGTPDSTLSTNRETTNDVPPVPAPLTFPPERRRPPLPNLGDSSSRLSSSNDNFIPAPLSSPGMRREDLKPPIRSKERPPNRDRDPSFNKPITPVSMDSFDGGSQPKDLNSIEQNPATPTSISGPTITSPQASLTSPTPTMPAEPEEDLRPGLGPMIKKKSRQDVAGAFLRAAKTANAFKPRAGGAAERLREAKKSPEGPDGITGVFNAPSLLRATSNDTVSRPTTPLTPMPGTSNTMSPKKPPNDIPDVKITVPEAVRPGSVEGPVPTPKATSLLPEMPKPREVKRVKSPAETMAKELATLGVDPSVLGGRGGELVAAWDEFGWVGDGVRTKNIDQMKDEIDRELNKMQAGGWLSRLEEEDERIEAIKQGFDHVIEECDELDGLLTLYLVELSTLNEDVAYIEAQSQGLQVQTANQKLLQTELKSLLRTINISAEQLQSLREASLESPRGLKEIEDSLVILFKAMQTIDPSLGASGPRSSEDGSLSSGKPGGFGNSELGSMRVLQEKKDVYKEEISTFLRRLRPFLQVKFAAAIDETRKALENEKGLSRSPGKAKLNHANHELARDMLWRYSPLMLFTREVDRAEWENLLKLYESVCKALYQDEFRDSNFAFRRLARKPNSDECDFLFTAQAEKHSEGLATTAARKLTVKRSGTLGKSLRSPMGDNSSKTNLDKSSDGRPEPYEMFDEALGQMVTMMSVEQNFIVEFFHVTSLEQHDFPDSVAVAKPEERRGGDLKQPKKMDPNRDLAKIVVQSMEEVYSFFAQDVQSLVEWALQSDPMQGVGLIAAVERKILDYEESSQEYLNRTLQKLHTQLIGLFTKFVDEQIRAIEDTKVKIKKRKGVIAFVKTFPAFLSATEKKLITANELEIRGTVNNAYTRINKAMFESLKVIARENPAAQMSTADPEDKEALNYQILLMQNMNFYLEEVDTRSNPVLEDWKSNAAQEWDEHLSLYLGAVIRRPLGKLLDYLESTENMMVARQPGDPITKISGLPSHSKSTFKKVLASYDSKEIRRGIDTLKKRVEKHFGDEHDPGMSSGGLVVKVLKACEQYYEKVEDRILTISRDVYDGEVIAEWTRADVSAAFRK